MEEVYSFSNYIGKQTACPAPNWSGAELVIGYKEPKMTTFLQALIAKGYAYDH